MLCCYLLCDLWPDLKMDVRQMDAFEAGSFDAVVDKGAPFSVFMYIGFFR